jgi:hypothetical protein|tara:strand:+ start:1160 stop:2323 length:1164 start_codon:yes stop_codon:yes gene_type:complete
MTLIKSLQRHFVFAIATFFLLSGSAYAKKHKLSGQVFDPEQEKVKGAEIAFILDGNIEKEVTTDRKGKFKEKLEEGVYTVRASYDGLIAEKQGVDLSDNVELELILAEPKIPEPEKEMTETMGKANMASQISVSVPQTSSSLGGPSKDFILNELNFEIKKLSAEFKHISQEIDDLKALSKMWVNPLTIYSKEIILKNGSTVFGKIIYQDDKSLKVETLVGYLIVDRAQVVRIVDNVITEDTQEYVPEQIRDSYSPPPMPKLAQPKYTSSNNSGRNASAKFSANCVLVGNISEKKDGQGNIIFNGEIKNIGGRRSDFVKVDFVFRKNWSGETKTLTTFVKGSYNTFDTGIVSDASLLPGAIGKFDLYVPQDFGAFIGYSYVIDWEEYQ